MEENVPTLQHQGRGECWKQEEVTGNLGSTAKIPRLSLIMPICLHLESMKHRLPKQLGTLDFMIGCDISQIDMDECVHTCVCM